MTKFNVIIVDDEEGARDILSSLVNRFCTNLEVVGTCSNVMDAVKLIKELKPDLVFLDIEMPNYAGYEIVSFFDKIDFDIIFVTAYDNYAIKAFEISAVDYLLKPIEIDRLKLAVKRFAEKKELNNFKNNYDALKENLTGDLPLKLIIPHQGEQKILEISTIIGLEASTSYTKVYLSNGESYLISKNLKHFENLFGAHNYFMRIHKSWIINLKFIQSYSKSDMTVVLRNELKGKLSKYKKQEFETKLKAYH